MDYTEVLTAVIQKERSIIGRIAIRRARELGISVSDSGEVRSFEGGGEERLKILVDEYENITGPSAVTIAHRAVADLFEEDEIPREIKEILE